MEIGWPVATHNKMEERAGVGVGKEMRRKERREWRKKREKYQGGRKKITLPDKNCGM